MRIAFVVPDDATAWLYYRQLTGEIQRRGPSVTVISAPGPYTSALRGAGVEHIPVRYERFVAPIADFGLLVELFRLFRHRKFDVVQNFTVKANLYAAAAAWLAGVPTIINTVEGAGILWSGKPARKIKLMRSVVESGLKALRDRVTLYWFVNQFDRDMYIGRRLARPDRSIVAISTGVDTSEFSRAAQHEAGKAVRHRLAPEADAKIVTMVAGRLLSSKGIETFLEVASRLRESDALVKAILVGPEEADHPDALPAGILSAAVAAGTVQSLGFRNDIAAIYAASDVVVVPTTYAEGIAKSVVEPMSMECAVVCSRTPAIAEMVSDGQDAVLVEPGNVEAMTKSVLLLLGDEAARRRIGRAARATVLHRFDAAQQSRLATQRVYVDHLHLALNEDEDA